MPIMPTVRFRLIAPAIAAQITITAAVIDETTNAVVGFEPCGAIANAMTPQTTRNTAYAYMIRVDFISHLLVNLKRPHRSHVVLHFQHRPQIAQLPAPTFRFVAHGDQR